MEFFDCMSIPQRFFEYYGFSAETAEEYIAKLLKIQFISIYVAAGLYLICLVFGGIGLMSMAKRAGIAHGWIGFLPFGNTYLAGKLAGETNFFGKKVKRIGLYAMLAEMLYVAFNIFFLIVMFQLYNADFYDVKIGETSNVLVLNVDNIPQGLRWLVKAFSVGQIFSYIIYFIMLFVFCILFYALFRKYYARGPFLMTFLSAFLPFRGFVLFAVRNNAPVDYEAYMRRRFEEMQRRQGYGGQGYGGQGNGGQSYGGQPNGGRGNDSAPEDPFSEFGGSKPENDPFSEFGNSGDDRS